MLHKSLVTAAKARTAYVRTSVEEETRPGCLGTLWQSHGGGNEGEDGRALVPRPGVALPRQISGEWRKTQLSLGLRAEGALKRRSRFLRAGAKLDTWKWA